MPQSPQTLRQIHPQLETARSLTRRPRRDTSRKSQVEALDILLEDGFEPGDLVELVGRRSCGRFSTLLRTLAAFTRRGETAALVDLGDNLDPGVAMQAGIDLSRLLWARPRHLKPALITTELLLNTGFPLVVLDLGSPPVPGGRGNEASWVRLARTAQKRRGVLLVSSPYRASGTTAQAIVEASRAKVRWRGSGRSPRLLDTLGVELKLAKAHGRAPMPSRALEWRARHPAP